MGRERLEKRPDWLSLARGEPDSAGAAACELRRHRRRLVAPRLLRTAADDPAVSRLTDLPRPRRLDFLESTDRLGEAVELACGAADPAFRRINLEILGNTDAFLHAHLWPRYDWEPPDRIGYPVWLYPEENWTDPAAALGSQHDTLRAAIKAQLARPNLLI
jgi:diadenosine tetraphosphate (Ap4A) HIT family hydrolase